MSTWEPATTERVPQRTILLMILEVTSTSPTGGTMIEWSLGADWHQAIR